MLTSVYDQNHNGIVDNAEKVNNHTVEADVPQDAVFTDTTYTAGTGIDITNGVISNTQTSAEWGNITGTLSNQTDLDNALDSKQENITQQTSAPSNPSEGDLWIDTDESGVTNIDNTVSTSSTNPVENQAITNYVNDKVSGDLVVDSIRTKNMFSTVWENGNFDNSGNKSSSTSFMRTANPIHVNSNTTYTLKISQSNNQIVIYRYSSSGYIDLDYIQNTDTYTFTTPANCTYINFRVSGQNLTLTTMLNEGNTALTYSPYQNLNGYDNYSTGEQVIGTWINGKPLYRKTLYFTSNGGGTGEVSYTLSNYGITNVDTIFITHPSFYSNNLNGYRNPFQYYDGNKFSCGVNATSLNVTLGYAPISNSPFVITLEYTKTTD